MSHDDYSFCAKTLEVPSHSKYMPMALFSVTGIDKEYIRIYVAIALL